MTTLKSVLVVCVILIAHAQDATTVEIASGVHMPRINLGTCCGSDPAIGIPAWFKAGGTGIDTAWDYDDETVIAQQIKASGKDRTDFFVTTKVPAGIGAFLAKNTTDCSADPSISLNYVIDNLKQLGLKYVDLVLLHAPCRFAQPPVKNATASDNALWKGLQRAKEMGLTRAIGVSNYNSAELASLEGAVPSINQCQMSVGPDNNHSKGWPMPPIAHDDATIAYCIKNNITYEAWRVIGGCPMSDPKLSAIATAHSKTPVQVKLGARTILFLRRLPCLAALPFLPCSQRILTPPSSPSSSPSSPRSTPPPSLKPLPTSITLSSPPPPPDLLAVGTTARCCHCLGHRG
jgi:diketogulonate reductase-like aldo/keto reductase